VFADLYRAHAPAVAVAVRDRLREPKAVADIVQEVVFTRALERLSTLHDADRFRPWVLAIARNAAADEGRFRDETAAAVPSNEPSPGEVESDRGRSRPGSPAWVSSAFGRRSLRLPSASPRVRPRSSCIAPAGGYGTRSRSGCA
jgi:DNA-directed RNA polymerase specialized sigma24 family protein